MKALTIITTTLLLLVTLTGNSSAVSLNCLIDENINPHVFCLKTELTDPGYVYYNDNVDVVRGEDLVFLGPVMIEPFGLGPIPAVGVGATSPCDMYVNMNCAENGSPIHAKEVSVADQGNICFDRHDVMFRPTSDQTWTTIGVFLLPC